MTEVAIAEALEESLSPSQVNTYMTCPAKWHFRYLIGLSEPTTGALALGKAFHGTLALNFRQKLRTGRDMETQELREVFAEEWSATLVEATLRDDEDVDKLAATGQILAATYATEAAGPLQPHAVEQTVQGEIGGVKVGGIVDLLDTGRRVVDFKTASKRPNGVSAEHSLQLTTYAMITPGASGLCRLDTVTKTKTVQVIQQSYQVGSEDRRLAEALYPMAHDPFGTGFARRAAAIPCVLVGTAATGASAITSSADAFQSNCSPIPNCPFPVFLSISPNGI